MTSEIIPLTTTASNLTTERISNIIDIRIIDISISLIEPFSGIPDFLTEYQMPYPIVIHRGEKFLPIGGGQKLQVVPEHLETVRCIEYVLSDNSDESIAIEKIALFVKPAGGSASFGEIIWAVASLITFIKNLPETTIIEGWGGLRRGKEFKEGEKLTQILADRLGKSLDTARRYIYYGKDLSLECLKELAESKANRNFFENIQPKKTKFIDSLTGKSTEEITAMVSKRVLEWWTEYNTPKEDKPKSQKTKQPAPENTINALPIQGIKYNPGSQAAGQSAITVDQQAALLQQDQPKEIGDNVTPDEEDTPEKESENDVKSEDTQQASSLNLLVIKGNAQDSTSNIYGEMNKIGNKLIEVSKDKPVEEALYRKLQDIIAELTALLPIVSATGRALPEITLMEVNKWGSSYPSAVGQA